MSPPNPIQMNSGSEFPSNSIFSQSMTSPIGRGSLIQFQYSFHKPGHDPTPLVLVTDVWQRYIRGINIHYLTFPVIKNLIQQNCENASFSYSIFKGDEYIVSAFRQYKREGVSRPRKLDCAFLLDVLASVRTLNPSEVEAIRQDIRRQISQVSQPRAVDMANPPETNIQ